MPHDAAKKKTTKDNIFFSFKEEAFPEQARLHSGLGPEREGGHLVALSPWKTVCEEGQTGTDSSTKHHPPCGSVSPPET